VSGVGSCSHARQLFLWCPQFSCFCDCSLWLLLYLHLHCSWEGRAVVFSWRRQLTMGVHNRLCIFLPILEDLIGKFSYVVLYCVYLTCVLLTFLLAMFSSSNQWQLGLPITSRCDRNSGHRICMTFLKFWVVYHILIYSHDLKLMNSLHRHCSLSLLFTVKVKAGYFVRSGIVKMWRFVCNLIGTCSLEVNALL
jgi:hypothetical protein